MPGNYVIRCATRAEVDIAVDWAAREGWNPGLHDADCFFAADHEGFLLGLLDGEPIATISVVRYGTGDAFLGFYIVRPEFRGRGHGLALWQEAMRRMAGRNVGLDGVVAQQDNYRKSGFALAWQNVRQQGLGGGVTNPDARIVPLTNVPQAQVEAYDRVHFPAGRSAFLQCWLRQPGSSVLAFVERGQVFGYGMIRPCREGWKFGPLFADSPEIAELLFAALRSHAPATHNVYLDTPAANPNALELARRHAMQPVFETARMYTGRLPPVPLDRLYGVTSFELG
jgi:GNAT superfamily N-acetyltransferase